MAGFPGHGRCFQLVNLYGVQAISHTRRRNPYEYWQLFVTSHRVEYLINQSFSNKDSVLVVLVVLGTKNCNSIQVAHGRMLLRNARTQRWLLDGKKRGDDLRPAC